MANRKRNVQEDAVLLDRASQRQAALTVEPVLAELALHIRLRIEAAKRIGIHKVRLDMLPMRDANILLHLVEREISACRLAMLTNSDQQTNS